ncbi:hypothetical protein OS493_017563 [Desmophyllum pertusum]|uniref:Uncharacterized protein n=1 Tax=Desmophyllum pertusum TaxID=174260 RepID=A0A9W9ZNY2_9CNID|nr:hypothetical protein OS493_017563 [Desmophyllum pertusum]
MAGSDGRHVGVKGHALVAMLMIETSGSGGKAVVWLDNEDKKEIYINTKSFYGQNRLDTIATRVAPGYHTITVRTVGEGNFLVSGVLVGPSDFKENEYCKSLLIPYGQHIDHETLKFTREDDHLLLSLS